MSQTPVLNVKPAPTCRFDELSLGEVMLRLDPGEGRVANIARDDVARAAAAALIKAPGGRFDLTGPEPRILREGPISAQAVADVLGTDVASLSA